MQAASPRERQRRTRARKRVGLAVFRLELGEGAAIEALILAGRLTEGEALRRRSVERELAAVMSEWAAMWLRSHA